MNRPNLTIISSFSLIPYLVVAWGYREMTQRDANAFWNALACCLESDDVSPSLKHWVTSWIGGCTDES